MTEDQIREYLKGRGCPETVWRGGSEGLMRRWERFVAEVESGYGRELCHRRVLERLGYARTDPRHRLWRQGR